MLASSGDRQASSGTLESTTTILPPGRRTSMSGRSAPSLVWIVLCSRKSQCETMPAISTTLRNWISPHEPRVAGRLSAETRLPVSWRSVPTPSPSWRIICASSPWAWRRSRSRREISLALRPRLTGALGQLLAGVGEHVDGDGLEIVAQANAAGAHGQHGAERAGERSEDQQ